MNFIELAKDRFSVRDFSSRPVEDEKIEKILEAAKVAPTAVNYRTNSSVAVDGYSIPSRCQTRGDGDYTEVDFSNDYFFIFH